MKVTAFAVVWLIAASAWANPPAPRSIPNCVPSIVPGPLSVGLAFLWTTIGGLQLDLVDGVYGNNTGGAGPIAGVYGAQTDLSAGGVSFENEPALITTDNGAGTGNFTLIALANPPSLTAVNDSYYVFSFGHGNNVVYLTVDDRTTGDVTMSVYDGTGSYVVSTTGAVLDGKFHLIIAAYASSTSAWAIYIDGVPQSVTITYGGTPATISGTKAGVGGYHDGSSPTPGMSVALAAAYNRALTPAEITAISIDPMGSLLECK